MNFDFNLKEKKIHFNADVEKLIDKRMDQKDKHPEQRKSRYQIKQEEKRKNKEQEHQHKMTETRLLLGACAVLFILIAIMAFLEG